LPADGSLSDEQFAVFLNACREELVAKQATFTAGLESSAPWYYDLPTESLTVGSRIYRITAIGTHSDEYGTWLWAWANDTFPQVARDASAAIKGLHERTGFKVFVDPGIEADRADAQDFAALAIHQLSAIGLYHSDSDETRLYLAVHER